MTRAQREKWEQALIHEQVRALACEDFEKARRIGREREALVPTPVSVDPTERLLNQARLAGPKVSWGPAPDPAEQRRLRKLDDLLEARGLKPRSRW